MHLTESTFQSNYPRTQEEVKTAINIALNPFHNISLVFQCDPGVIDYQFPIFEEISPTKENFVFENRQKSATTVSTSVWQT